MFHRLALLVLLALPLAAADNVLTAGVFAGQSGTPAGWTIEEWHRDKVQVVSEGGETFLRLASPQKGHLIIATTLRVDPAWKRLRLVAKVRVKDLQKGDAGWKSARIETKVPEVAPIDLDEQGGAWQTVERELPVSGLSEAGILVGFWESCGTFDIAELRVEVVEPKQK